MARKAQWPPPVYPHKPSGMDRMRVYVEGKAKDFVLGPIGSDLARAEYSRILAEIETVKQLPPVRRTPISCAQLADMFRQYCLNFYGKSHTSRVCKALEPVLNLYGHTLASQFGSRALETCQREWVKKGYCRGHCNALLVQVKACWSWGVRKELVAPDAYDSLTHVPGLRIGKTDAPESPPVRAVDMNLLKQTLPFMPRQIQDMVQLQLYTGCRPGEICLIKPCHINQAWLSIDSIPIWMYSVEKHKTGWRGFARQIPIGPKAQGVLTSYLAKRGAEEFVFSPLETTLEYTGHLPYSVKRPPRQNYSTTSYGQAIARACRRGNLQRWAPNQIRHEVGTQALVNVDQDMARCVLGHQTTQMTTVYTEDARKAAIWAQKYG